MRPGRFVRLLPFLLLTAHALAYVLWTEDDAAISLRAVTNLTDGHGPVYNPGERVEAISNLGWVLLLTPFHAFVAPSGTPIGLLVTAKIIGLVAALVGLGELARLGRACGLGEGAIVAAQTVTAASSAYAGWAASAMETPLVALAAAALVAAAAELSHAARPGSSRRLALAGAALVLLRIDGFVIVLCVLVLLILLTRRRPPLAAIVGPAATLVLSVSYRRLYFGRWLPLPVAAKIDLTASLGRAADTLRHYLWPFLTDHGTLVLFALGLLWAVRAPPDRRRPAMLAAGTILGLFVYSLLVGRDWMPLYRFLVPCVVPLSVIIVGAVSRALEWLPSRATSLIRVSLLAGLVAGQGLAGWRSFRTRRATPIWYLHPTADPNALVSFWLPAVNWLERELPTDALLVTSEAGFIPYLSGLRTIDSYGLTTPAIADLPRGSVRRSTLGVETRFGPQPPADPAQQYLADSGADVVILQDRMIRGWNDGRRPQHLFDRRWVLSADSPVDRWAIYERR